MGAVADVPTGGGICVVVPPTGRVEDASLVGRAGWVCVGYIPIGGDDVCPAGELFAVVLPIGLVDDTALVG